MSLLRNNAAVYGLVLVLAVVTPLAFPTYMTQLALLWAMVVFSMTWDTMGGQMGYNSFGNIVFYGIGMYACAVVQRDSGLGYFPALSLGLAAAAALAVVTAWLIGSGILGLRGHYFAIGSLGLGIAAAEIAGGIDYIGAGSGMTTPLYPEGIGKREIFFYASFFALAVATFFALKWLYAGRFGLALNAIRDDEDKAEAMGLHTTRYKTVAWIVSAFFLSISGGLMGNLQKFIDPRDTAFAGPTIGVWMVLMAILGGKGTIWGPVIGAIVFLVAKELFWTYLLGWQYVALGLMIVVIVVFFPQGIMGYIRERHPHLMGETVDPAKGEEAAK